MNGWRLGQPRACSQVQRDPAEAQSKTCGLPTSVYTGSVRFLLQYFAVTVCLIALAWAFVSVPVGDRSLYGHLLRTDLGGSLAQKWNAWEPSKVAVKKTEPKKAKAEPKKDKPAQLARATEPRRKGEPTVQTEKGALKRVNRLGEAAAKLRD